jgi:hypothetical protein
MQCLIKQIHNSKNLSLSLPVRRRKFELRYVFNLPLQDNMLWSYLLDYPRLSRDEHYSINGLNAAEIGVPSGFKWQITESQTLHGKESWEKSLLNFQTQTPIIRSSPFKPETPVHARR